MGCGASRSQEHVFTGNRPTYQASPETYASGGGSPEETSIPKQEDERYYIKNGKFYVPGGDPVVWFVVDPGQILFTDCQKIQRRSWEGGHTRSAHIELYCEMWKVCNRNEIPRPVIMYAGSIDKDGRMKGTSLFNCAQFRHDFLWALQPQNMHVDTHQELVSCRPAP